jgi:orotate phosphoribosyltransferase
MESNVLDLLPIRRGHFRFESGYHGEIWLDLDRLFANPRRIAPLARELAGKLSGHDVEAVVGPLVGGAFLAQMIAAELGAEFAYTQPQPAAAGGQLYSVAYRLPSTVAPLLKDKRVAIVDDAINAGSALRGTFQALVAAGARPAVAGALIVLSDTARPFLAANGLALEQLATLAAPLWAPEVCPLCARRVPLDSPAHS